MHSLGAYDAVEWASGYTHEGNEGVLAVEGFQRPDPLSGDLTPCGSCPWGSNGWGDNKHTPSEDLPESPSGQISASWAAGILYRARQQHPHPALHAIHWQHGYPGLAGDASYRLQIFFSRE